MTVGRRRRVRPRLFYLAVNVLEKTFGGRRCSLKASAGVFQPSVLRGRLLSAVATASTSSALHRDRSVPLGASVYVKLLAVAS